jgi:hypothetical protein
VVSFWQSGPTPDQPSRFAGPLEVTKVPLDRKALILRNDVAWANPVLHRRQ